MQNKFKSGYSYHGRHIPSGEEWYIIGINEAKDSVCVAGYPPTKANLSDMEDMQEYEPLTEDELQYRDSKFGHDWQ